MTLQGYRSKEREKNIAKAIESIEYFAPSKDTPREKVNLGDLPMYWHRVNENLYGRDYDEYIN